MNVYIDIMGWIGTSMVLGNYFFVSTGRVNGDNLWIQFFYVIGSVLLLVNTFYCHAFPSVAINAVYLVIAVIAIIKRVKKNRALGVGSSS